MGQAPSINLAMTSQAVGARLRFASGRTCLDRSAVDKSTLSLQYVIAYHPLHHMIAPLNAAKFKKANVLTKSVAILMRLMKLFIENAVEMLRI